MWRQRRHGGDGDVETEKTRGDGDVETEVGMTSLGHQEARKLKEAKKDPFLELPVEAGLCQCLDFTL